MQEAAVTFDRSHLLLTARNPDEYSGRFDAQYLNKERFTQAMAQLLGISSTKNDRDIIAIPISLL